MKRGTDGDFVFFPLLVFNFLEYCIFQGGLDKITEVHRMKKKERLQHNYIICESRRPNGLLVTVCTSLPPKLPAPLRPSRHMQWRLGSAAE